mmetsp:Transcript_26897/g.58721  ORF Transcript_26897/g.58721 Transcript_26897/m.58721 type:complete len:229 (+) Transcript_26897:144-830(+)|eukprot:CAMPEP_0202910456 /NCGR_PEP_ID=MMETSP1392-20130828/52115_1 /ASSEMBLY_ACC=CAM_ASM_000868 /TAXON_ID=225041 /ORGANISM="Chlamydomonas chlamydogama, Strain SAG 11-48b" /LENGTH=228 /DNA_ID=CAMNT_0049600579 /DNA_START=127 /DNA_END=813 /DNA_ORIENTATION=+
MVQTCTSDILPLVKILLHAAKYPHCTINGVLLGSVDGSSNSVKIVDAIPLFHVSTSLAPPTELALSQVEAYTSQSQGKLQLVGYYHSEARYQAADMGPISRRVADRISDKYPGAVAVLLDNKKLGAFLQDQAGKEKTDDSKAVVPATAHPFDLFTRDGRNWKREAASQFSLSGSGSSWKVLQENFVSLFKQQAHRNLNDFDEHLDDPSKDYLNPGLSKLGKFELPGQL